MLLLILLSKLLLVQSHLRGSPSDIHSAEIIYPTHYRYGRFEARCLYGKGDGIISSFFLWKAGSEKDTEPWNELDFEKVGTNRLGWGRLHLNAITGTPGPDGIRWGYTRTQNDITARFHDYSFEWTPETLSWYIDGKLVKQLQKGSDKHTFFEETGEKGMQFRFNIWPGDKTFGGKFHPEDLPSVQLIDWVKYSAYDPTTGDFKEEWREDFTNATSLPKPWRAVTWLSPLKYSKHFKDNVQMVDGYAALTLTKENEQPSKEAIRELISSAHEDAKRTDTAYQFASLTSQLCHFTNLC